ncbi:hypothetical protein AO9_01190 [Chlamydia psittaci Mat116]|nr:hypothetical protein AO9_01190 [Chlamydia psittaci Mat116]
MYTPTVTRANSTEDTASKAKAGMAKTMAKVIPATPVPSVRALRMDKEVIFSTLSHFFVEISLGENMGLKSEVLWLRRGFMLAINYNYI